ncbi:MAG: transposase [Candidatus Nezhaarchaeales archaeon]
MRRRILRLNIPLHRSLNELNDPIAIDASGISVHKYGGWVEHVHGRKKRYVKIHFAVNVKTKEIIAMHITTDDVHDSKVLPTLINGAVKRRILSKVLMDGGYDSYKAYRLLNRYGLKPLIKPRINAKQDRGASE